MKNGSTGASHVESTRKTLETREPFRNERQPDLKKLFAVPALPKATVRDESWGNRDRFFLYECE